MARKSRKDNSNVRSVSIGGSSTPTAGYVRLSVKDLKNEGDSIETQKKIILNYINNHPELQFSDFYIDNGISGTTFERRAFSSMIEEVEKGSIRCIVVKDITRFGRDMIDIGYYTTQYFPSKGIRFISINDNFDSAKDDVDLIFTLKSLFSEYYATDIGNKVRSVIKHQMKSGKFVGSRPPFGYVKELKDCHQLVVDEPAANVVRQIFGWAADDRSISEIVRLLNDTNVTTPSHYQLQEGIIHNAKMAGGGSWHAKTVSKLLSNEVYIGKLVQGKTRTRNKQQAASPEDLIVTENAHEPIISSELFVRVQEILSNRRRERDENNNRQYKPYPPNLFVGRIFCSHCGSPLNRKKNYQAYIYRCTTSYSAPGKCIGNSIKEAALIEAMAEQIIRCMDIVPEDNPPDMECIKHELEKLQVELSYKGDVVPGLFKSLYNGDISEEEFKELKIMEGHKFEQLEKRREQLAMYYEEQKAAREDRQQLKSALSEFRQSMELTQYLVDNLLRRIDIRKDGKIFIELK